jgi:uncharacterized protein (TIGR00369 family)
MADAPTSGADIMAAFIPNSPLVAHLGIEIVRLDADAVTLRLPFLEHNITTGATVHGGAIATLADTAAMAAAWCDGPVPAQLRGSTVTLTVNYLAPANESDLTARARVLRRGRSLVQIAVDITDNDDGPVATASAVYKLG